MWKNTATDNLFDTVLMLENRAEAQDFFRDLLTEEEILEFANRWQVACMLAKHTPYTEIARETGMSSTTTARISKWLKGGCGGYTRMIKRVKNEKNSSKTE